MIPHDLLRTCISRDRPGIEIGPWCNPIAPKRDGYRTTVIDVCEQEPLRQMAENRGIRAEKVANLESVDIVGDASRIRELVRAAGITTRYGWIISSHNLEHLPDPIGFLTGCSELLDPDGLLGMVIPDKRFCFDRFQPLTTLAGMLRARAALADPFEPSWTAFQQKSLAARLVADDGSRRHAWARETDQPDEIVVGDCRPAFRALADSLTQGTPEVFHGHRWRFTPASFELLVLDLRAVGLIALEVETICDTVGTGFGVRMRPAQPWNPPSEELAERRSALLRRIEDELATVSGAYRRLLEECDRLKPPPSAGDVSPLADTVRAPDASLAGSPDELPE
ncbi:MAG: hypothetical protein ACKOCX_00650 [Planctomycetota bacterium]